jgi:hypothetical protein
MDDMYCYRDADNKLACDNKFGLADYTYKNPKTYTMNLQVEKIPVFIGQNYQVNYCKIMCNKNQSCYGFKSIYNTNNNTYSCEFYKPNVDLSSKLLLDN